MFSSHGQLLSGLFFVTIVKQLKFFEAKMISLKTTTEHFHQRQIYTLKQQLIIDFLKSKILKWWQCLQITRNINKIWNAAYILGHLDFQLYIYIYIVHGWSKVHAYNINYDLGLNNKLIVFTSIESINTKLHMKYTLGWLWTIRLCSFTFFQGLLF